jgi:hypothetical protein
MTRQAWHSRWFGADVAALAVCIALAGARGGAQAASTNMAAGLVAHYFHDARYWNGAWPDTSSEPRDSPANHTFSTYAYSRVESRVNHRFIREGWFSVRWVGYIDLSSTARTNDAGREADVTFRIWADDGCRLIVDGDVLIDSWIACWEKTLKSWRTSKSVKLSDGPHRLVLEYFQGQSLPEGDRDPLTLYWSCPGRSVTDWQIMPDACLFHTDDDTTGTTR